MDNAENPNKKYLSDKTSKHSHPADYTNGIVSVRQALYQSYVYLNEESKNTVSPEIFSDTGDNIVFKKLQKDLEIMPVLLMDELQTAEFTTDKGQYLRLVQALLVNISDLLLTKDGQLAQICIKIENILHLIQDFFYQYFDFDYRVSSYCLNELKASFDLKLEYWKIKMPQSLIADILKECIYEKVVSHEHYLTFRKTNYLKHLFQHIESATNAINEAYIRKLLLFYDFNSAIYVAYEIGLLKEKIPDKSSAEETINFLQKKIAEVNEITTKQSVSFDINLPGIKKQLNEWLEKEIKQVQINNQRVSEKDLVLDPELKIQTSLSVAKLAVLVRLMVADKIIINKSVASMLRTVAKLFTTLQKDEISFGSLETKYHAPDKATLKIVKEILQKWVVIIEKL